MTVLLITLDLADLFWIFILLLFIVVCIGSAIVSNIKKPKEPTFWDYIEEGQNKFWKPKK